VLPEEGEMVCFDWESFMDKKKEIKKLKKYEDNGALICNILFRKYYKEYVETHIVLFEEAVYRESIKHRAFNQLAAR
jgi:hypothetical protein